MSIPETRVFMDKLETEANGPEVGIEFKDIVFPARDGREIGIRVWQRQSAPSTKQASLAVIYHGGGMEASGGNTSRSQCADHEFARVDLREPCERTR